MKKVLVTGGCGFIGSHLVEKLVREGYDTTILDQKIPDNFTNPLILNNTLLLEADLILALEGGDLKLEEYDVIFHLAGSSYVPYSVSNPFADFNLNAGITIRLLESLRNVSNPPKIIYASSGAVYGNPAKYPIQEGDPTSPTSPYGVSKLTAERYISVYNKLYGLPGASLRIFSVFGPGLLKQVIYDILKKLKHNSNELMLLGDGKQERDFIYVDDVVDAFITIANNGSLSGEVYNIASGKSTTIDHLAKTICKVLQVNPKIIYSKKARPGDPDRWVVDISRILSLGFRPNWPLEKGLKTTSKWFLEH